MTDFEKITIEFTIREARIILSSIQHYNPPREDEMISIMLYSRITRKIEEVAKNES